MRPSHSQRCIEQCRESDQMIYQGLQLLNSQSSARQASLARSTAENQRLRGQLTQLKRQVTESTLAPPTRRVNQSLPCMFQNSPHSPQRAREFCRSRSSVRHTSVDELQKRCATALSEMSRWRRRWKRQEMELQLERQRLGVLQANQQTDLQIRKRFLASICQLIQEASRHIDLVVQKHLEKFCSGPSAPPKPHSPTDGSPSRVVDLENPQVLEVGQPDRPSPSPRCKMLLFSPQQNSVLPHSLELTPTGDERSNQPVNHAQPQKRVLVTNTCSVVSKRIESSMGTRDRCVALMDTNCNNNIRTSQSFTPAFGSRSVRSTTGYQRGMWTDTSQFSLVDNFGTRAQFPTPETPTGGSRMQNFSPFESSRSALQSVATTGDPYDADTPVGLEQSTTSASPEQTPDEASDSVISPATEVVCTETSLFSSTPLSVENPRLLAQEQLNALRAAVRHELSKVLANIVDHAKKITELQMQLIHGAGSEEPAKHHAITSLSEVALNEVKCHNLQASRHLTSALSVTNKIDGAIPLNKGMLISQSPVQISVSAENPTPQLQTLAVPSAMLAKTTATTDTMVTASAASVSELELTITSDPGLRLSQSSDVTSRNPVVSRRSTGSKVAQPRERWKPVGGVIHTSQWRNALTFGTGHTQLQTTCKHKSTDSVRQSLTTQTSTDTNADANVCLPLVRVRRDGRTDTRSSTRLGKGKDSDTRFAPSRAQSERPCVQPPPNTSTPRFQRNSKPCLQIIHLSAEGSEPLLGFGQSKRRVQLKVKARPKRKRTLSTHPVSLVVY
ncbi:unnamed protein product [Dicrocoelium dendriticum]|nr:unnamed protein product [Dicrocoelium dendriticum]